MSLQIIIIVVGFVIAVIGYFISLSREELKERWKILTVILSLLVVSTGLSICLTVKTVMKEKKAERRWNIIYEETKTDFAIRHYVELLKADVYFFVGKWIGEMGYSDKAANLYIRSIETFPNYHPYSYNNLAAIQIEKIITGEEKGGSIIYKTMALLEKSDSLFRENIASARTELERCDFRIGLAQVISNKALLLEHSGNLTRAESLYIYASNLLIGTESITKYVTPYTNLAVLYSKQKKVDEAERWFKKAIEIDPDCGEARFHYGEFLLSQKRDSEARNEYFSALRKVGVHRFADVLNRLAITSDRLGEKGMAKFFLKVPLTWEDFQKNSPEYNEKFKNALKQIGK